MTITATSTLLSITSTLLETYADGSTHALTVRVRYNCNTGTTIEVEEEDIDTDTLELTPAAIGQSNTFSEGVYYIEVKATPNSSGTVYTDTYIWYYAPTVPCKLLAYYADKSIDCLNTQPCNHNEYFWAYVFHDLLSQANTCTEFTYSKACVVYESMSAILGTTNNGDCGCS